MKYAAYDALAIYAVGDTPDAAVAKAREDARDNEAVFSVAAIDDASAEKIEADGFNAHSDGFDVVGGRIVLQLARDRAK